MCAGAFVRASDLERRRRSKGRPEGISMKSFSAVKSELQLKRRSGAAAERRGFLHFLHSNSHHDLTACRASHWTYPHGSWSATSERSDRVPANWRAMDFMVPALLVLSCLQSSPSGCWLHPRRCYLFQDLEAGLQRSALTDLSRLNQGWNSRLPSTWGGSRWTLERSGPECVCVPRT